MIGNPGAPCASIPMETAALIGLALLVISEILPYTPLKSNGVVQLLVDALREVFPHKSHTDK